MKGQIAVLVDGDQLGPDGMPALLQELGKTWTVTERICVRNWRSTRDQQAWREFASEHAFRLIQRDPVAAGKNASDIELAVIAMDLLAAGHRAFCLVSGDMDFTPLVDRLRRGGCHVEWVRPADMPRAGGASPRGRGRARGASSRAKAPPARSRGAPEAPVKAARAAANPSAAQPKPGVAPKPRAAQPTPTPAQPSRSRPGPKPGASRPATVKPGASPSGGAGAADLDGFSRAVRRVIAELRRAGEHERGWVSVNRLGSKLTEAGTTKDDFGFPKRRPLWAALQEAGFETEQMETGQYRVTLGTS